jgi:hypothetical protein
MELQISSKELLNAVEVPSSITDSKNIIEQYNDISNQVRNALLCKDKNLFKPYDMGSIYKCKSDSGNDAFRNILQLLRDFYILKYKNNNVKDLTSRKIFDTMLSSLECLMVNDIDVSTNEINALLLGFLTKNFL